MKIDISDKRFNPYIHLSNALFEWVCENWSYFDTLIVDIRTSVLGDDRIIASFDGDYCGYDFDTDWYEGGEVELLGITPLHEIGEAKYKLWFKEVKLWITRS